MESENDSIHGTAGSNKESPSCTSVVAQWAQGWERRLRDEAVECGADLRGAPKAAAVRLDELFEDRGRC